MSVLINDEENQLSPKKKVAGADSADDASFEPEPAHGCLVRLVLGILSALSVGSVGYILIHYILAPIHYIGFLAAKCTVCGVCCPPTIARTFRNIALTPIRWARLAALGVGHIECWTHPAWPFRPAMKPYTS